MTRKGNTFLRHFGQLGKAHHLVAATVGKDWPVPTHEPVQAAELRYTLGAGTKHEMIGVPKDDVGAARAYLVGAHRLDRGRSAHWHESRRPNLAALHFNDARARGAVSRGHIEAEAGHRRRGLSADAGRGNAWGRASIPG